MSSLIDPQRLWRSIEELSETPELTDALQREFPRMAGEWGDPATRRSFLKRMAASLGLAGIGISGCLKQPEEKIVPYVRQPEDFVPGKPLYYATCTSLGGYATGVLVESHMGRPTKIEGNPDHPASLGATDAFAQASILSLYDPDRSQTVMKTGHISTWGEFQSAIADRLPELRRQRGRGLAILTETVTSPSLAHQMRSLLNDLPEATWHQYEPVGRDNVRAGSQLAFGEYVDTIYHFDQADVVVALDADFLAGMPGSVRYARQFADRRRIANATNAAGDKTPGMSRVYAVESTPGLTGAAADHCWQMRPSEVQTLARRLAAAIGNTEGDKRAADSGTGSPASRNWEDVLVSDLKAHAGRSLVIAGEGMPASVHALVHAINRQLGNTGTTVEYVAPVEAEPTDQLDSLTLLVDRMNRGLVQVLIVLGGNPVYASPGELNFRSAYERVGFRVHLSSYYDETSFESHWHIPAAHELEAWGDARAFDGTVTIQQPLIAPLYAGRTPQDVLSLLLGRPQQTTYEIVRAYWKDRLGGDDFEPHWKRVLHDGVVPETRAETRTPEWQAANDRKGPGTDRSAVRETDLEVQFVPDPTIWDGRFANNGWLQELPKPLTKLTWDNAVLISPQTAERLDLENCDLVDVSVSGRTVQGAVWIVPGHAEHSITLTLGYGRVRSGRIGNGTGFDAYRVRPALHAWSHRGAEVRKAGTRYELSVTQRHHSLEGRDLLPISTLAQFEQTPEFIDARLRHPEQQPTLYPKVEESENAWGMTIDQTACIGCNACVVACQAENNIPIVGKEQVGIGREMHWLRIDRYYRGPIESPETDFQPVMCVHCENAPCELVCPVAATVHSHEGLNQMVYNRCVGTRYCSNNCPYKVRRFNFLDYDGLLNSGQQSSPLQLLQNPDVTVRSRGVMEKCTYCVQRISEGRIAAQNEGRPIRDGEVVTACQQACPAKAITFGNLRDRSSIVSKLKTSPLNYSLLGELNTLPRTTHLARIRNPHPELAGPPHEEPPPIEPSPVDRIFQKLESSSKPFTEPKS